MVWWYRCFTSVFVSEANGEPIETLGDATLGDLIVERCLAENPTATPDQLSKAKSYYGKNQILAKIIDSINTSYQGKTFDELVLVDWSVITTDRMRIALKADIYETIIGTIKIVTNLYLRSRLGHEFAYQWFNYTYAKAGINIEIGKGNDSTILTQMFSRFSEVGFDIELKKEKIDRTIDVPMQGRMVKITVIGFRYILPKSSVEKIRLLQSKRNVYGRTFGNTIELPALPGDWVLISDDYRPLPMFSQLYSHNNRYVYQEVTPLATAEAAEEALKVLAIYGLTPEWSSKVKEHMESFSSEEGRVTERLMYDKLLNNGFVDYSIEKITGKYKSESTNTLKLIGYRENREPQLLLVIAGGGNVPELKRELITKFIYT
jgi:hypothetical protein